MLPGGCIPALIRELVELVYADVDPLQISFVQGVQDMLLVGNLSNSLYGGEDVYEQLLNGVSSDTPSHIYNVCVLLLFPVYA